MVAEGKMSHAVDRTRRRSATIRRTNIKVEKYDELSDEFRQQRAPAGQSTSCWVCRARPATSFSERPPAVHRPRGAGRWSTPTELLVNSPMNDPEYRDTHEIEDAAPARAPAGTPCVISTATFAREEYDQMNRRCLDFLLFENFGVLRQVARYVRQETGVREIDFYELLRDASRRRSRAWPSIAITLLRVPELMVPPVSWRYLLDE